MSHRLDSLQKVHPPFFQTWMPGLALTSMLATGGLNATAQTRPVERELVGQAYLQADAAYKAYDQGNFAAALSFARKALKQRPDVSRLHDLLRNAQAAFDAERTRAKPPNIMRNPQKGPDAAEAIYGLLREGKTTQALRLSRAGIDANPLDQAVWAAHVNALLASGKSAEAAQEVDKGIAKFGLSDNLMLLRENVRRQLAEEAKVQIYRALERQDVNAAVTAARETIAHAPDVMDNHLLLLSILMNTQRYASAIQAANEAIAMDGDDVMPRLLRGYLYQFQGQRAKATADFQTVLAEPTLTPLEQKNYRVIMADAALAADEDQEALNLLQPLYDQGAFASEIQVEWRRRAAQAKLWNIRNDATREASVLRPLSLDCRSTPYGRECVIQPAAPMADAAYALAAEAYTALAQNDGAAALTKATQAHKLNPGSKDIQFLLSEALMQSHQMEAARDLLDKLVADQPDNAAFRVRRGELRALSGQQHLAHDDFNAALKMDALPLPQTLSLLARLDRKNEAGQRLENALERGDKVADSPLELAYLALHLDKDQMALNAFEQADDSSRLSTPALQDAAFTAIRLEQDLQAQAYLVRAANLLMDKPPVLRSSAELKSMEAIRSTIANISREWGAMASVSYRGTVPGRGGIDSSAVNNSLQVGVEAYWRPLGWRNGKLLEIFARAFETPYSQGGGLTGNDSAQGSIGFRVKPWPDQNLIFGASRLFPIASRMSSDTLVQTAYSYSQGGELRSDRASWPTYQVYAEAGRYLHSHQTYAVTHARLGLSYRLEQITPGLVAIPHMVIADDYNSAYLQRSAVGLGPGVQFRYWYRQDLYNAHRSYVDLTLQYRTRLAGDEQRAKGAFVTLLTSY